MSEQVNSEKSQSILEAAQKRFARYGLAKVTMDEIAQDLGMSKASLYYYFPTKESIFRAVIAQEQERFIQAMQAILSQAVSAGEKLRLYLENRWPNLRGLLNLSAVNLNSCYQMTPIIGDLYEAFAQNEAELIRQILDEGQKRLEFAAADSKECAIVLLHMLKGLRFYFFKADEDRDHQGYAQLTSEMAVLTRIILYGLAIPQGEDSRSLQL
jgi:TetR/AcrR family transcriptional repressor of mexJK operon